MTSLSRSFTLEELCYSETATRSGIDNTPSPEIILKLTHLCTSILEPVRVQFGAISVQSGYRCPKLNALTSGSSSTSAHVLGYAADINPHRTVNKFKVAIWIVENCKFDQLILEYGTPEVPSWLHVSADPRSRGQILLKLIGQNYKQINLDYLKSHLT